MEVMNIGEISITWLDGGNTQLDGGAMFGVVPKPLWERKYPCNEVNQINLRSDPLLVQIGGKNILIESGIGNGKLSDKQKRNFGVSGESKIDDCLKSLGLSTNDIDYVLMTHMHFDHACGLTKWENDQLVPTFKYAKIVVNQIEWEEALSPNIRSKNTYWEENVLPIKEQVTTFVEEVEIVPGIKMLHTGGHSNGHSIILFESEGEKAIHMADIMPTHAHQNVLWVMAYDDFPMDSIKAKQEWMKLGLEENVWYTFYHDSFYRAIKWDADGKIIDFVKIKESEGI